MKQQLYLFTFSLIIFSLVYAPVNAEPEPDNQETEPVVVVVEGTAPIIENNLGNAKTIAKQDAYRRAIEEAVGVKITAHTQMEMLAVVSDVVISKAAGYIRNATVLEDWRDKDDIYHVKIEAEVQRGDIHDDLSGLKILIDYIVGNPVVMTIFQEENLGEIPMYSAAEAEMSKIFSSAGYHLVAEDQMRSMRETEADLTNKVLAGDERATTSLADRYNADIVVVGRISTEKFTEEYTAQAGLTNAVAKASVKVIMARTSQVIIAKQSTAKSVHLSAATAGTDAITRCAGEIASELIYEIPTRLSESRTIKVTVSNCMFSQRKKIIEGLEKKASILGVFPRAYVENTVIFDVKTWGNSERIAEYLDKMDEPRINIITVNSGEVIAEVLDEE
jgi:RNA-binding protein YhbY